MLSNKYNFISLLWLLLLVLFAILANSQTIVDTYQGFPANFLSNLKQDMWGWGKQTMCNCFTTSLNPRGTQRRTLCCSGLREALVVLLSPDWFTKLVASIIFLDAPVGTGFSYARTSQGYNITDQISAAQTYDFLRKWLMDHQEFMSNVLYVGGDSYSGIIVPIIIQEIHNGNRVGRALLMKLTGYLIGNPVTDQGRDANARVEYARGMALISDEIYEINP